MQPYTHTGTEAMIYREMKKLIKRGALILIAIICTSTHSALPVLAQDDANYNKMFNQMYAPYYDPNCTPGQSPSGSTIGTDIESIYMVGDSITLAAKDYYGLVQKFKKKGIDATIDAAGAGSLTYAGTTGTKKTGLQSIEDRKNIIKNVDAVVIAHGTNHFPDNQFKNAIKQAVNKVRNINNDVEIIWVNTNTNVPGSSSSSAAATKNKNKIINQQSQSLKFSVIDIPSANIPLAPGDGIHPDYSEKGMGKWGQTVVDGVASGSSDPANIETDVQETAGCCPVGSSAPGNASLVGSNNVEKTFNFFKSQGLTDIQAAAIIGNLSQESSPEIEPMLIEGGRKSKDPRDAGGGGYGIVQWTPGAKVLDVAKNYNIKGPIHELETQLQIVIAEMKGTSPPGHKNIMKDFKKINNLEEAVVFFQDKYEAPGIPHTSNRINFAKEALQKYGSGDVASSGATTDTAGCTCQDPASSVGQLSGANPKNLSEFVKKYADSALAAAKRAGIPYDAMLAQIAHESGLPLSQLAAKYNNFGGIKYTGEGKSTPPMATQEAGQGTIMARFRAFDTAEEGLYEQAMFFVNNSRYRKALNYPRNPSRFIDEVARAGYATDPSYASKVKAMLKEVQRELRKQGKPLSREVQPERQPSGGDLSDSPVNSADCSGVSGGVVIDGFAFPVGGLKKNEVGANNPLPCRKAAGEEGNKGSKGGCHHEGTAAFDLGRAGSGGILGNKSEGLPVYAIEDGTIRNFRTTYNGIAGCPSYQLKGKSGWWYWYGHTKKATLKEGKKVEAGEKIAEIGPSKCSGVDPNDARTTKTPPHLHIDRGSPKGHYGGSPSARDSSINELINKLWEALP